MASVERRGLRLLAGGRLLVARLLTVLAAVLFASGVAACLMLPHGCRVATLLGSEAAYFLLGVVVYTLLDTGVGGAAVASAALAASATVFLKELFLAPRPPGASLVGARGPGFPSGHTAVTAGFWLGAAFYTGDPLLAGAGFMLSLLVAYTRVAIGAHYVGDVVGGLLVGLVSAYVAAVLVRRDGVAAGLVESLPAAAAAATVAGIVSPGYGAAWRLLGISVGGYAAGLAVLLRRGGAAVEPRGLGGRVAALAVSLTGLSVAAVLERLGVAGAVAGFAVFAAAVFLSPLLAGGLARRGG